MQLLDDFKTFYHQHDLGQSRDLSDQALDLYHERLLNENRVIYELGPNGNLLGYIESWRVTSEQIGRILFDERFDIHKEEISSGPICYVANITIHPDYRRIGILQILKARHLQQNFMCTHFCGNANHGRAKAFKIFTKKAYWAEHERTVNKNV